MRGRSQVRFGLVIFTVIDTSIVTFMSMITFIKQESGT
jgi:hypothetical protein